MVKSQWRETHTIHRNKNIKTCIKKKQDIIVILKLNNVILNIFLSVLREQRRRGKLSWFG